MPNGPLHITPRDIHIIDQVRARVRELVGHIHRHWRTCPTVPRAACIGARVSHDLDHLTPVEMRYIAEEALSMLAEAPEKGV